MRFSLVNTSKMAVDDSYWPSDQGTNVKRIETVDQGTNVKRIELVIVNVIHNNLLLLMILFLLMLSQCRKQRD